MFDTRLRPLIDPALNAIAGVLAGRVSANAVTIFGLALAGLCSVAIVLGWFWLALALVVANRLADGLDGALARRAGGSDLGAYYDIVFDFFFYGAVPLAFALHNPAVNALPAALLLASFYANGATFLAFAALAAKRRLSSEAQGKKAIYYFAGIAEGTETIVVFLAMCLWPSLFPMLAVGFAALCALSAGARVIAVRGVLRPEPGNQRSDAATRYRLEAKKSTRSAAASRSRNPP